MVSRPHFFRFLLTSLIVCVCLSVAGCASVGGTSSAQSLYARLGESEGVTALVDGLLARIAADERILHHFSDTDVALFRASLVEHLCFISDGPCVYSGETMRDSHRGLNITEADFDALVGHLMAAMKSQGIRVSTQNILLARLAPLYQDITYQ